MMKNAVKNMGAQLKLWGLEIDDLVARTQLSGKPCSFDTIMHLDELKALHAVAQLKFDNFVEGADSEKARTWPELDEAWNDLVIAFKKPIS